MRSWRSPRENEVIALMAPLSPLHASTTPVRRNSVRHFSQEELAGRWGISARTLERWRWLGQGPAFLKIGGRVAYRLEDIESFEADQRRAPTTISDPFFRGRR